MITRDFNGIAGRHKNIECSVSNKSESDVSFILRLLFRDYCLHNLELRHDFYYSAGLLHAARVDD